MSSKGGSTILHARREVATRVDIQINQPKVTGRLSIRSHLIENSSVPLSDMSKVSFADPFEVFFIHQFTIWN